MVGKATLFVVAGFSLIFLIVEYNMGNVSTRAVSNFADYYIRNVAHEAAVSGANFAANEIFIDRTWTTGFITKINGATVDVSVKVDNSKKTRTISSIANLNGIKDTVQVVLRPSYFSKFGNYYATMASAIPATGDIFDGPFHVEGNLLCYGHPEFNGKVTSLGTIVQYISGDNPIFNSTYQSGVSLPMEFDTTGMRQNADFILTGPAGKGIDVEMEFSNEKIKYRTKVNGETDWSKQTTIKITDVAPNGKIYIQGGNLYVKGTLKGQLTVVTTKLGYTGYGNIYQTADIKYKTDPVINPTSTDMLGLICEENYRIVNSPQTVNKDIITQASMYAMNGTIRPDDVLALGSSTLKDWKILGGLIAHDVGYTANYDWSGNPVNGFRFRHTYDQRFLVDVPPGFPDTKNFEIVSWYE